MKARTFTLILLLFAVTVSAQTYGELWKNVTRLDWDDRPKSALAEVQKIYDKAKAEHDVSQMMKAYLSMMTYRGRISPDSIPIDVKALEEWANRSDVEVHDRAVLYSILGGVHISKDFEKGDYFLKLSLKDSLNLVDYPAEKMVPMVQSGKTSRLYMDDNLYDLLARRAINLWKQNQRRTKVEVVQQTIKQTYQSLLSLYKRKGNRQAWVLTALEAFPNSDEQQLRKWIASYGDLDVCAEFYLRLAKLLNLETTEKVRLLREAIRRYSKYDRISNLKSLEQDLTTPSLNIRIEAYPDTCPQLTANYRLLNGLTLKVYRLDLPSESSLLRETSFEKIKKHGKLFRKEHIALSPTRDYKIRTEQKTLQPLPTGIYYWEAQPDGHKKIIQGDLLYVTALDFIYQELNDVMRVIVVDKQSGFPVPYAQLLEFEEKKGKLMKKKTYTANKNGGIPGLKMQKNYYLARTANDTVMPPRRLWPTSTIDKPEKLQEHIRLFTDRSIYRPGQKVYYSGMVYTQLKDSVRVKSGNSYKVTLLDVNNREVASHQVETDEFGTFSGTFELPETGKLGAYPIKVNKQIITHVRMEEYKRPTFNVTFDTLNNVYQAGDSIRVTGVARAFSGAPIQGANVKYQINRMKRNVWRGRDWMNEDEGTAMTDENGRFEIPLYLHPVFENEKVWTYDYDITVDVTGMSGETQSGKMSLPLSSTSLLLYIPGWNGRETTTILKEERKTINFGVTNLQGFPKDIEVDYRIYTEKKNEKNKTILGDCVLHEKATSNREFVPEKLYALPSGTYRLKFAVWDEKGRKNEQEVSFILFSDQDKQIPCEESMWFYQPQIEFDENGIATCYFGSKEKNVHLFLGLFSENRSLGARYVVFSDSLLTFRYKYREEWGKGLRVTFAFMKNGRFYEHSMHFKNPEPDKRLELKWKTFRNQLQPGSKEVWTLSVLHPDGKPANARLMATMYDASLDYLMSNNWYFRLSFNRHLMRVFWNYQNLRTSSSYFRFPTKRFTYNALEFSSLFEPYEAPMAFTGSAMTVKSIQHENRLPKNVMARNTFIEYDSEVESTTLREAVVEGGPRNIQIRSDFAETAFFYPQLRTDANGDVNIEFTLPESLTEWKFMGVAHTVDMDYGNIAAEVKAVKEFMLQPNLPRFVRIGDRVDIPASLVNLSGKEVNGTVRMELFLPETEKVILTQERPFRVMAGQTEKVSFGFDVSDAYEGLAIRMVADGGMFSDGEQRYLPVLSNKQKLTESVLLNVNGAGKFTFSLEELFNHHSKTVSHPHMIVEFTGNPLWYAIRSLKAVRNPENDNSLSWATAYYSNALLAHLAKVEPRIADSLQVDGLDASLSESVLKLKYLQNADGSWSWFKGMNGSLFMTIAITQQLARLHRITGIWPDDGVVSMYQKALAYLNKKVAEEVQWMKKFEKERSVDVEPSEWTLQYLYILALDKSLDKQKKMTDYLVDKLTKMSGGLTIYGKALSAIILQQAGKTEKARMFLQSMMEYSVSSEEMGRYFDTPKAQYSWFSYRIPTQVAAIEAIQMVANEEKTQEEMKQWLLKQKQAQAWETPIATADAVYALLTTGKDWLQHTGSTSIKIGKQTFHTPYDALGYMKQEVTDRVMNIRKVTVERKIPGIGWGAVYAEFEEDMDKVEAQGNALKIVRNIYRNGKLLPEGTLLQVGERLTVRLTLTSDRDMDFVKVTDGRAACMEPLDALSGYRWKKGMGYYLETKDASTSFYLDKVRKGTHIMEYEVYVTTPGRFTQGVAEVRSTYAPEFGGHESNGSLNVK